MITYMLLSQVLVSDNLVPRVFSLSNMAAAVGEKTFSPTAAILESEKTLGTRLGIGEKSPG